MKLIILPCLILLLQGLHKASAQDQEQRQDLPPPRRPQQSGGFGSFLSGLLGSVTKTASVDSCPGKCIHSLASLICDDVREEVECPSPNMRCCVEKGAPLPSLGDENNKKKDKSSETSVEEKNTSEEEVSDQMDDNKEEVAKLEEEEDVTHKPKKRRRKNKNTTTTTTTITEVTTTTAEPTTSQSKKQDDDYDDDDYEYTSPGNSSEAKSCPGVCVADRISCFCEAILNVTELCKDDLRCCVAKKIFSDDDAPKELIIPKEDPRCGNKKETNLKEKVTEEEKQDNEEKVEQVKDNDLEMMDTAESITSEVINKDEEKKEKIKEEKKETVEPEIPEEKRCKGTCVAGFFALLCDAVDKNGECPGKGKCCINKPPPTPTPGKRTRPTQPSSPKPRPSPPANRNEGRKCPGVCIPNVMLGLCSSPSKIVSGTNTCSSDSFCCDHGQGGLDRAEPVLQAPIRPQPQKPSRPQQPPRPSGPDFTQLLLSAAPALIGAASGSQSTAQTISSLMPLLGPVLSGMLAPKQPQQPINNRIQRPPPPTRPTPPPTTTTTQPTTTTTEIPDDREECPGTCIAPYLSFTCFGNAETTEIFKCTKRKTICCSPKSAVKKVQESLFRANFPTMNEGQQGQQRRPQIQGRPPLHPPPIRRNYTNDQRPYNPYEDTDEEVIDYDTYDPYPFPVTSTNERPELRYPVTNKYVCGVKGTHRKGRVVGGDDGAPGEWCWQVALINSLNQYLCGGALIGTQWVLTAAHCVTNIVRAGDAIYVRVGDHDLTQKFGSPGAQTLRVATTYIHHNHNSQTLDNDIALLKLHGEAELKEGVCLVCLPARGTSQVTGKKCTVTGYGYMGETGPIPLRIREARVPIVNDNECVRKINSVTEKIFILPASSFCAGGEKGHDACQGDGGGPLVCEDSGYHELTGLVSWGFGCGRKDVPGVYVKVSSFIGWINQIISVNNS